jgi:hypothetical protein
MAEPARVVSWIAASQGLTVDHGAELSRHSREAIEEKNRQFPPIIGPPGHSVSS